MMLAIAACLQVELRVEEFRDGAHAVESGTLVVRPVGEGGADPRRFTPPELWMIPPTEWPRLFEISREAAPSEPPLPESIVNAKGEALPPIRARLTAASTATAGPAGPELEILRLVPRDEELRRKFPSLVAWVEKESGRLLRVEAAGDGRRRIFERRRP